MQSLLLTPQDRILEVGTGTGYMAACLAKLGREVLTVDLFEDFRDEGAGRLAGHGIANVTLEIRDCARGWDGDEEIFDAIAVTASLPVLHEGFHRALTIGGRLFVVAGTPPAMEALLITRTGASQWATESLFETTIPPLVHAPEPDRFSF
jgi:protein-L-isoaspartate(D-aspartate) O-methyltransferase